MTLQEILSHLKGVKGSGPQYSALCPAHGDKNQSLSISVGSDGRILLHCHAGCATEDIVWAMGLQMKDLFVALKPDDVFPVYDTPKVQSKARFEREHLYPGGQIKKVVMRKPDGGKYAYWMHKENDQWVKGRGKIAPPLYITGPLPEDVYIVEGEKDVLTMKALGAAAASLPDGAKSKWLPAYGEALKGRRVAIIPDNDGPGRELAQRVAGELQGIAQAVKVLDLAQAWPEIPEKGDVSDMVAALGEDRTAAALVELERAAPEWTPQTVAEADDLLSCFKTLDEFQEEEARWIIPGWIPEAQLTLMAADGGVGKTTLWCHIIAALSNGGVCILDPPGHTREPVKVVFLTTEDSVRKKLRKKLRLMGANMANIITPDFTGDKSGLLHKLKFGSPEMEKVLRHFHPTLCAFDPVQGFVPPKVNMGSRNEMRDCMAPLISVGEEVGTTSLVVAHTNKRKGASGRDRIADSADLWDISRSVLMAGFTEEHGVRYLSNEKNNYAQLQETILFTIDDNGCVQRVGTSWKRDREFMQDNADAKSAPKREDCKAFILKTLNEAGGALPTNDIDARAKTAGYSFTAMKRAKADLKREGSVRYFQTGSTKTGNNIWHIQVTAGDPEQDFIELPAGTSTPWDRDSPSDI